MANTAPRDIPVVKEQEKCRRVDSTSILEEALKDYQVAAQTLTTELITEKFLWRTDNSISNTSSEQLENGAQSLLQHTPLPFV